MKKGLFAKNPKPRERSRTKRSSGQLPPRPPTSASLPRSASVSPLLGFADHDAISLWWPKHKPQTPSTSPGKIKGLGKRRALSSPTECWIYKHRRPRYRASSALLQPYTSQTLSQVIKGLEREKNALEQEIAEDILETANASILSIEPTRRDDNDVETNDDYVEDDACNLLLSCHEPSQHNMSVDELHGTSPSALAHDKNPDTSSSLYFDPAFEHGAHKQSEMDTDNVSEPIYDTVVSPVLPIANTILNSSHELNLRAAAQLKFKYPTGRPRLATPKDAGEPEAPVAAQILNSDIDMQSEISSLDRTMMSAENHSQADVNDATSNTEGQPGAVGTTLPSRDQQGSGRHEPPSLVSGQATDLSLPPGTNAQCLQGLNPGQGAAPPLNPTLDQQSQLPGAVHFNPYVSNLQPTTQFSHSQAQMFGLQPAHPGHLPLYSSDRVTTGMPGSTAHQMSALLQQQSLAACEQQRRMLQAASRNVGVSNPAPAATNSVYSMDNVTQQLEQLAAAQRLMNVSAAPFYPGLPMNPMTNLLQMNQLQSTLSAGMMNQHQNQMMQGIPSQMTASLNTTQPVVPQPVGQSCAVPSVSSNQIDHHPLTTPSPAMESCSSYQLDGAAKEIGRTMRKAIIVYSDDFEGLDPANVSTTSLRSLVNQATTLKSELQQAFIDLGDHPPDFIPQGLQQQGEAARGGLKGFIRGAEQILRNLEGSGVSQAQPAGASQAPSQSDRSVSQQSKAARVLATKDELISELKAFEIQLEVSIDNEPTCEKTFKALHDQHQSLARQIRSVKSNATRMADLAGDAGLSDIATQVEQLSQSVQKKERCLDNHVQGFRDRYSSGATGAGGKTYDVKAPIFSGDLAKDKTDFYDFSKRWADFVSAKCLTPGDSLRTLKLTTLQGAARDLCDDLEDVDEIFKKLKASYGDPRVLLMAKLDELRKTGKCEGSALKKRDWLIAAKAKMLNLQKLAVTHNITGSLYYSDIAKEVIQRLPHRTVEAIKDEIRESDQTEDGYAENLYNVVVIAIQDAIEDATLTMRLDSTTSKPQPERPKRQEAPNPVVPGKKTYSAEVPSTVREDKDAAEKPDGKEKKKTLTKKKTKLKSAPTKVTSAYVKPALVKCGLCQSQHTHLFYCETFLGFHVDDRNKPASKVRTCFRCLRLDAEVDFGNKVAWKKQHQSNCSTKFTCEIDLCGQRSEYTRWHILMCRAHYDKNKSLEKKFIDSLDKAQYTPSLKFFFNLTPVNSVIPSNPPTQRVFDGFEVKRDINHNAIFMLQNTLVNGKELLTFYDSGCLSCCISDKAAAILNSICVRPGPTKMHVAGGDVVELEGGDEQFILTLVKHNTKAYMTGIRLPTVTSEFPCWPIHKAWERLQKDYNECCPDGPELPPHPSKIGGDEVQLMIGIRYNHLYPELITTLPSGLGIYKSQIAAPRGEILILGGPHEVWDHTAAATNMMSPVAFLSAETRAWYFHQSTLKNLPPLLSTDLSSLPLDEMGFEVPAETLHSHFTESSDLLEDECPCYDKACTDPAPTCSSAHCSKHDDSVEWFVPPEWDMSMTFSLRDSLNKYLESELNGSDISYRCFRCRNCVDCRKGELIESISLKEEKEQHAIEKSVTYDPTMKKLTAKLPFVLPPENHLNPNRFIAEGILDSQMKLIARNPEIKDDVFAAHDKLQSRGHVVPLLELPEEIQAKVTDPKTPHYFIPWRTVAKPGSISTPVRIVFDASSVTPGGDSLNNTLAKGVNKLMNISHILSRFRTGKSGFTADIKMAYNNLQLHPDHYRYHLYLWKPALTIEDPAVVMVVLTVIYGVRPSGNQLQAGLGQLGQHCIDNFPEHTDGALAVVNNVYVDDILAPASDHESAKHLAESVDFTLGLGSMGVKAYTFAGEVPSPEVSADGVHVGLVGMLWEPVGDLISLDIKDLYLGKARRGRLPPLVEGDVAEALRPKFTRRIIVGKVSAVYDPLGLLTPITCKFKLDLHGLCELKADWDDLLPESYLLEWVQNLDTIQKLKEIKFRRSVIPPDAASTDIEILVSSDASQHLALACVHARVKLKSGGYSAQLMSARSKLVNFNTIPKGELKAAAMAAALAHTARTNLGHKYSGSIHVTDSTVSLYWISQDTRPLETLVRNAVIEIRRLSNVEAWYHVESALNPADLGTRPATLDQVGFDSSWQIGQPWMQLELENMPLKTIEDITLTSESKRLASQEARSPEPCGIVLPEMGMKVADRYDFSQYLVDPNRFNWSKSVLTMAYIMKFVRIKAPDWKPVYEPDPQPGVSINSLDHLQKVAANYYFFKGTQEVKQFSKPKDYKTDSIEKNGILHYTGRIPDGQTLADPLNAFVDVNILHFVQPILDRYSPVAYSVMLHCHANVVQHRSSPTTLRESRSLAYVLKGRDLANEISEHCRPCKRYRVRLIEAELGPLHSSRLTIAPPFFLVQIDLFGPIEMVCEHHHRSTLRGYGVVFKDPATGCVAAFALQAYSTPAFLQAFTRFSSRYGVPSKVLIDQGSQLVCAFEKMELCVRDIEKTLNTSYNVSIEYDTSPVSGHNYSGMVERSIGEIKRLLNKTFSGLRTDLLTLETNLAWVCSEINSLPLCLGSRTEGLGNLDLITPSRLLLGRNNRRSLGGYAKLDKPSRMLDQQDATYKSWWEIWRTEKLIDFIPQPHYWEKTNETLKIGDIVAFPRKGDDRQFGDQVYRLGRVTKLNLSSDNICRDIIIEYKNENEKDFRSTNRAIRSVAKVHSEDQLDIIQTLNQAVKKTEKSYYLHGETKSSVVMSVVDSFILTSKPDSSIALAVPDECNASCPAAQWKDDTQQ